MPDGRVGTLERHCPTSPSVIWRKCVRPEVRPALCSHAGHLSAFVPVTSSAQAPTKREIVNSPERPSEEIRAQCLLPMCTGLNLIPMGVMIPPLLWRVMFNPLCQRIHLQIPLSPLICINTLRTLFNTDLSASFLSPLVLTVISLVNHGFSPEERASVWGGGGSGRNPLTQNPTTGSNATKASTQAKGKVL